MNKQRIIDFCFLYPLVLNALNIQGWISLYFSPTFGQLLSYSNILFIGIGLSLLINRKKEYSKLSALWAIFFFAYYFMSMIASFFYNYFESSLLASLVPVIFFVGNHSYFRFKENRRKFEIVAIIIFSIANFFLIFFVMINFDYDLYKNNISISYKLDRAQGLYGDANNAALVAILGYIFVHQCFITKNNFQKVLKIVLLAISAYALYLTYSTTGFVVFIMSFGLLNYKYFTRERLLVLPIILIGFYFTLLNLSSLLEGVIDLNPRQQSKIDNFVNLLKLDFDNVDDSGRDRFVAKLMDYIEESPFIGNGLEFGSHHHGHNTYLYILSDAGIFALIIFVILLFKYFESIFKIDINSRLFALAIMVSFCMFMLSLQTIINQPYLMVVFVYLAYYIDNKIKKQQAII